MFGIIALKIIFTIFVIITMALLIAVIFDIEEWQFFIGKLLLFFVSLLGIASIILVFIGLYAIWSI